MALKYLIRLGCQNQRLAVYSWDRSSFCVQLYSDSRKCTNWHTVKLQVVGPPGCGKTQLCLLLSVMATLPSSVGGVGSQVVYVDTEAAFTAERSALRPGCHGNCPCYKTCKLN